MLRNPNPIPVHLGRLAVILGALAACACAKVQIGYIAAPFFSEERFARVRPGMTDEQVRDLLGYPLSRFGPVLGSGRVDWMYAFPASVEPPIRYPNFEVSFSPEGTVLSVAVREAGMEDHASLSDRLHSEKNCVRDVGDLCLIRPDTTTDVLKATDPGLYVFLLDHDSVDEGPRSLNRGPDWFRDAVEGLLRDGTIKAVRHLYIGTHPARYAALVAGLPPEQARRCYLDTVPPVDLTNRDLDSCMLLFKAGRLYSVPVLYYTNLDDCIEDQKWLIRKLGTEGNGQTRSVQPAE